MIETRDFSPLVSAPTTVFDAERDRPPLIPHVYDIDPDPQTSSTILKSRRFEQIGLKLLADQTPEDHVILGPNLIMKALNGSFFIHHPTPDAMIFRPSPEGLSLTEMTEFKTKRVRGQRKVDGFGRLLGKIRTNKDLFNKKFQDVIGEKYYLPTLTVPDNDEIEFTFGTPRELQNATLQPLTTRCRVFYFQVPLPKAS